MSAAICQKVMNGHQVIAAIGVLVPRISSSHSGFFHSRSVFHQTTGSVSFCR